MSDNGNESSVMAVLGRDTPGESRQSTAPAILAHLFLLGFSPELLLK